MNWKLKFILIVWSVIVLANIIAYTIVYPILYPTLSFADYKIPVIISNVIMLSIPIGVVVYNTIKENN